MKFLVIYVVIKVQIHSILLVLVLISFLVVSIINMLGVIKFVTIYDFLLNTEILNKITLTLYLPSFDQNLFIVALLFHVRLS